MDDRCNPLGNAGVGVFWGACLLDDDGESGASADDHLAGACVEVAVEGVGEGLVGLDVHGGADIAQDRA